MMDAVVHRTDSIGVIFVVSFVVAFVLNPAHTAEKTPEYKCCAETELAYSNGDTELAGVLLRPVGGGEYPAAVILQGSGDSDRSNRWARLIAETFVSKGVAVLLTDKRGSGQSGGSWRTASFEDLAEDGLAGIRALRRVKGIRKDRLGFIGLSQGGHVAPLAASMGNIQFVINMVGGALPMKDMLFHELEQTYRQYGLGDARIEELQQLTEASFVYIETGQGFDEYLQCREQIENRYGQVATASWPNTPGDNYWVFWRSIYDYDPIPYWREVVDGQGIPAFVAYGELDEADNVPVKASTRRLHSELAGKTLTVKVYPDTGHSLMDEALRSQGRYVLVQGLLDDLDAWLESNL
ncbi:MAG: alpha/beta hydrolase family protein [Woeseia sp.]